VDALSGLMAGFEVALSPGNLWFCLIGVALGTLVGVLPGVSSLAAVAMLLPFTHALSPTAALVLLAGVYYGSEYGGAIAAILLNVPGTPASAVSCLDGHPMARAGRAREALILSAGASFGGAVVGIGMMLAMAAPLAGLAFMLGPAEYFAIMIFGLVCTAAVGRGRLATGMVAMLAGVGLAMVGTDAQTGVARFTLGLTELRDGIPLVVLAMGLFGVSEVMLSMFGALPVVRGGIGERSALPRWKAWRRAAGPVLRGGVLGGLFGALPGTGPTLASIAAYALERRLSARPECFGRGAIAGLAAPEAANNAAAQTAFVPTLALGIPGSATMALMLGAMSAHGVVPSPLLAVENPELFWGLMASFVIGNLLLLVLNVPLVGVWVRILRLPPQRLYPLVLVLIAVATFGVRGSAFDVWAALAIGLVAYGMRRSGVHLAPVLIGFVLGPLVEDNFRRALAISQGDFAIFVSSPIALAALGAVFVLLAVAVCRSMRSARAA